MQQMCPVQYTYSMLRKHELHHAMKKKEKKEKNCTCYDYHKRGIQEFFMWYVTTLNSANWHKRPREQNLKTSPK